MRQWHVHISGIVQGVGFRPLVYQIALRHRLHGHVSNGPSGLHIRFEAAQPAAEAFVEDILNQQPKRAHITSYSFEETEQTESFNSFQIIESETTGSTTALFTPDYALCDSCRQEINDPNNRRRDYAFTTCTQCGPRYSVIKTLPYDRENTSMEPFIMCESCQAEYNSPLDHRHFSQTNSCHQCGIKLYLLDRFGMQLGSNQNDIIQAVIAHWEAGKIVAIKGIGGFLLTCDAANTEAVARLRKRKNRPWKPLALMYPSLEHLEAFELKQQEKDYLTNEVSPIVLVDKVGQAKCLEGIAEELNQLGVMLPYTPLYEILLQAFQKPIVATSGNLSGSPIIYRDGDLDQLFQIADLALTNDREIVMPQDDSVIRFSPKYGQKIILRRSRGLAPNYLALADFFDKNMSFLACGADMKSAFALLHEGNCYISQYLGDLSQYDTQSLFNQTYSHWKNSLKCQPQFILHDAHPSYASTFLAHQFTSQLHIPMKSFQHHKAHFAAVLAENQLIRKNDKVLGIIWDGTGYGDDGQIWGGEFMIYRQGKIERNAHWQYFPHIAGDKMAREPKLSALSILPQASLVREKFTAAELRIYDQLLTQPKQQSASMGRIFDAVASILGICDVQTTEGEAAMKLEALAKTYPKKTFSKLHTYETEWIDNQIDTTFLLEQILAEMEVGMDKAFVALKFHQTLVACIIQRANDLGIQHIACSGGVFQNALLVDLLIHFSSNNLSLHFHQHLSPNDENIAFGQIVLAQLEQQLRQTKTYVSRNSR